MRRTKSRVFLSTPHSLRPLRRARRGQFPQIWKSAPAHIAAKVISQLLAATQPNG